MAKRRRKLRSLVVKESSETKSKRTLELSICITFLLLGLFGALYYSNINTSMIWVDFLSTYRNQYNQIVHGEKDYCLATIDAGKLLTQISHQVLNQQHALASVEVQLRNNSRFIAIAVVGTTGVGKSLFAQALKQHFPWQENTQIYSWSDVGSASQKQEEISTFANYLSECGRNLIIIDNLQPDDIDYVNEYNSYLTKRAAEETKVNLVVVYVFNVPSFTAEQREQYVGRMEQLNRLQNIEIVKFRKFNSVDIEDCIRHEARHLNLTLDGDGFEEVFKSINAQRSGCKNVHAKVLMYGLSDNQKV